MQWRKGNHHPDAYWDLMRSAGEFGEEESEEDSADGASIFSIDPEFVFGPALQPYVPPLSPERELFDDRNRPIPAPRPLVYRAPRTPAETAQMYESIFQGNIQDRLGNIEHITPEEYWRRQSREKKKQKPQKEVKAPPRKRNNRDDEDEKRESAAQRKYMNDIERNRRAEKN
jgi:hypothetical protein